VPSLLDQLRDQRATARTAGDEILTRASAEGRDPTAEELADLQRHVLAEREAADAMEAERDRQLAEVRAMATRGRQPTLTREAAETARAFRSAIFAKSPQPIEVYATQLDDEWPADLPEPIQGRAGRVQVHTRDTLKSTATQALPVSVYSRFVEHLVESSAVMAAGATVITTSTGEDLVVPKTTAYVTSAITTEGSSITESDPTLGTTTLKAYKYGNFFQISQELANDTPTNLLDVLSRQAAASLALAFGPHLITGTGTNQPRGVVTDSAVGQTGPTGQGGGFGPQTTAGSGGDQLINLQGSLAEPYMNSPSAAWIMRNATSTTIRLLRDGQSRYVFPMEGRPPSLLGAPVYRDPNVAAIATNGKSVIFGDISRYWVRIVDGVRFERSDDFAFQSDLVSFRCIVRLDGALVDLNATKVFQGAAT
jgi:HK97 family phage major capsid protein